MKNSLKSLINLAILTVIIVVALKTCTGCFSGLSSGKYKVTDAIGREYVIDIKSNGTAIYKMTTASKGGIDEIAYKEQREGIEGTWTKSCILRGNNKSVYYLAVSLPDAILYICEDGYIYNSISAMDSANKRAANPWKK